jgi:hypothetical protein
MDLTAFIVVLQESAGQNPRASPRPMPGDEGLGATASSPCCSFALLPLLR